MPVVARRAEEGNSLPIAFWGRSCYELTGVKFFEKEKEMSLFTTKIIIAIFMIIGGGFGCLLSKRMGIESFDRILMIVSNCIIGGIFGLIILITIGAIFDFNTPISQIL